MRNTVLPDDTERLMSMPGTGTGQILRLLDAGQRDDPEVRKDVLRALMLDSLVPMTVDAHVQDGIVTLTGTVRWHGERDDAVFLAASVPGVLGILDEITLIPAQGPDRGAVEDDVMAALDRSAVPDDSAVRVSSGDDGAVMLSGVVSSWADRDQAVTAAWSVPGVTSVEDLLLVRQ